MAKVDSESSFQIDMAVGIPIRSPHNRSQDCGGERRGLNTKLKVFCHDRVSAAEVSSCSSAHERAWQVSLMHRDLSSCIAEQQTNVASPFEYFAIIGNAAQPWRQMC